jgi:hypothetical protein
MSCIALAIGEVATVKESRMFTVWGVEQGPCSGLVLIDKESLLKGNVAPV